MIGPTSCRICGNETGNREFIFKEKMFGLGDEFPYFQCGKCACLQIAKFPENWARYYPPHYYSFAWIPVRTRGYSAWRHGRRDHWLLTGRGWLASKLARPRPPRADLISLRRINIQPDWAVLDVGCGRGQLLSILWRAGFRNLAGVDPFLEADADVAPGLKVRKLRLEDVREKFDLIMMHHVFEHLPEPGKTLAACRDRLNPGGQMLIRIPTVDSDAWERYRENWVDLDCPRHLHLLSRRSVEILAEQNRFRIKDWWCDGDGAQFWGSELYRRGIGFYDAAGKGIRHEDQFTGEELARFEREALAANARNRGSLVAVLLTPV